VLLTQRMLFAVFMSCCVPNSVSLICDYTLPKERGRAQSLFAAGMYMGVGLGSMSAILDEAIGWRSAIRAIGLICIFFAVLSVFLVEPERNANSVESLVDDMKKIEMQD